MGTFLISDTFVSLESELNEPHSNNNFHFISYYDS